MERIKIEGVYSESARLKEIIESHRWTLFDATLPEGKNRPFSWDELAKRGCAEQFEIGHNYEFAPMVSNRQTLRQAYSSTKGLGPSLQVEDGADETRWAGVYTATNFYYLKKPILFTRLDFTPDFLAAFSPPTREMPESDALGIWYPKVIETFEKYFRIVKPEEYGLTAPIIREHKLEDN